MKTKSPVPYPETMVVWEVLNDPDYLDWFDAQPEVVQDAILAVVLVLRNMGPRLGRPYVATLKGPNVSNLKELRVQCQGEPYRILFAFDPVRRAILLVGGNKAGDRRWYKINVPIAERRLTRHIEDMKREGEIP